MWRWTTILLVILLLVPLGATAAELHVSPTGQDDNLGTAQQPLRSLAGAQRAVRALKAKAAEPVTVLFHTGTYYLDDTVVFTAEDSGTQAGPVVYAAAPGEEAVLSGGAKLKLAWELYRDGIMKAAVPADLATDQLFVNGQSQPMARYPNFDANQRIFNGYAKDCFSPERAARWADPAGGFIHAMHAHLWGDFHYRITGKDATGKVTYEGGWQNNRRMGMHGEYRFVENIFEELDAPGEWFLDAKTHTLYFAPPPGLDLARATVEAVRLRHLVEFRGSEARPVRFVSLKGLVFRHAARTFMDNREPLLRSDWTIYRGGAVVFSGSEDCTLEDCFLDQLGGNAVFVNNYNRRVAVRGCHIARAGANGVALVGDPAAVRNPLFEAQERQNYAKIDRTPGPKIATYPADCTVEDCLIYQTGRVEKQTAPVQIAMSRGITVRHCSLYDVPRAGINIGDGCWGGHLVEFCDVFDTVKETGDHGSFNSWGRDRYWALNGVDLNKITLDPATRGLPLLDCVAPTILRNNRWRCDHGWDIDLDDGSSNYRIYNNLCLNGGIKLREGFFRVCENNIIVNNSFHPHVWYRDSQDIFRRNLVFARHAPINVPKPWGQECDFNLWHVPGLSGSEPAAELRRQSGLDEHSIRADAMFVDPARGDYTVREGSPALALAFRNFPMDQFGVRKPALRAIARTPELPGQRAGRPASAPKASDEKPAAWLGAKIKSISGMGEMSATGLGRQEGVRILEAPTGSEAAKAGLKPGDVILKLNGKTTAGAKDLLRLYAEAKEKKVELTVWRGQAEKTVVLEPGR